MKSAFWLILLLVLSARTYSTDTTFTNRFYTQFDGLSTYNVPDITQDKYGFLWIATQEGVNFFDGTTFKVFGRDYVGGFNGSDVRRIIYDHARNMVWVGFSTGGITAIDCQTHNKVNVAGMTALSELKNLWLTTNGELIIVTKKECFVYNLEKKVIISLLRHPTNLPEKYDFVAAWDDPQNYYFLEKQSGVICLSKDKKETMRRMAIPNIASTGEAFVRKVIRAGDNLYLATNRQIGFIDGSQQYRTIVSGINNLTTFGIDKLNNIWYSAESSLKKCTPAHPKGINVRMVDKNGLRERKQLNLSLFFDSQNNLWMGGSEGLLFSNLSPPVFLPYGYDPVSQTSLVHIYDILLVDSLAYVNDIDGLKLFDLPRKRLHVVDASGYPYYLLKLGNDMIFNNENGFAAIKGTRLDKEYIYKTYPELLAIKHRMLGYHLRMNDSLIVLGGEDFKGIILWDIKHHKVLEIPPDSSKGWENAAVNAICKAGEKELFICQDYLITQFHLDKGVTNKFKLVDPATGDSIQLYFDMVRIKRGFAIATYGFGVIITDSLFNIIKIINTSKGLSNNSVYRILKDQFGYLWATSNNGLTRINLDNYSCRRYFVQDGLQSNSFEEMSMAYMGRNLVAGGLEGFTVITPGNIVKSKPLTNIYFRSFELKFENSDSIFTNFELRRIQLPNNIAQIKIYLSAIGFSESEKTTYKYRITEKHKQWIDSSDQNFVSLMALYPGTYHFQVQAFNADGASSEIIEIELVFLPKWYQTMLFKAAMVVLIAGFLYAMYRYRLNRIRKQEQIRKEISNDLHDDIGSTLNSIKVFCNLALITPNNTEYLRQVNQQTQSAITSVRDIMWVLNDKLDTVNDLITRFEAFAEPLAHANRIDLEKYIHEDLVHHVLTKEEKRNLYLILKESFNNCIKYAEPRYFSYALSKNESSRITLTVKDDGKGFNTASQFQGNGLSSMKYRAEQIKYNFSIESSTKGTVIKFEKR